MNIFKQLLFLSFVVSAHLFGMHERIKLPIKQSHRKALMNFAKEYRTYAFEKKFPYDTEETRKHFLTKDNPFTTQTIIGIGMLRIEQGLLLLEQEEFQHDIETYTEKTRASSGSVISYLLKHQEILSKAAKTSKQKNTTDDEFLFKKPTPTDVSHENESFATAHSTSSSEESTPDLQGNLRKKHPFDEKISPLSMWLATNKPDSISTNQQYPQEPAELESSANFSDEDNDMFSFLT